MKKEQFDFICDLFQVGTFSRRNTIYDANLFPRIKHLEIFDASTSVEHFYSIDLSIETQSVKDRRFSYWLFERIPTRELAEEILKTIKDSEVLFV